VGEVSKTFPGKPTVRALDRVSFTLEPGQRTCLLGPNGAGKTTLIRLLTGALSPSSGQLRLFGVSPSEPHFLDAKRRVGIVPQSPGMYRDLTVREFLDVVRDLYGRGDQQEVLEAFGLSAYADRRMHLLSGGYQRRLSMAAAVLPKPELLLLDEPTVGLDPVASREIREYLLSVMKGRTTLLCTHNLLEAEELCDTAIIIRGGKVLLHERIDRLRERVASQLSLGAAEGPARLSEALTRLGHAPVVAGELVRVSLADPKRQAPELVRQLVAEGLGLYECHVVSPSLEDLFLDVVGKA
jgi:ABC-2 type transport system ATP-binding protein